MIKDFEYIAQFEVNPIEAVSNDIKLLGEDYINKLDETEFMLRYGITKDYFKHEFGSLNYAPLQADLDKFRPLTQGGMEEMMKTFRTEANSNLLTPPITKKKEKAPPKDMGTRPSQVAAKSTPKTAGPNDVSKPPNPKPALVTNEAFKQSPLEKEFLAYKQQLLRSTRGSIARTAINLREKALRKQLAEKDIRWGTPEWLALVKELFPGANFDISMESVNSLADITEPVNSDNMLPANPAELKTEAPETKETPEDNIYKDNIIEDNSDKDLPDKNEKVTNSGTNEKDPSGIITNDASNGIENNTKPAPISLNNADVKIEGGAESGSASSNFTQSVKDSANLIKQKGEEQGKNIIDGLPEVNTPIGMGANDKGETDKDKTEGPKLKSNLKDNDKLNDSSKPNLKNNIKPVIISKTDVVDSKINKVNNAEKSAEDVQNKILNMPVNDPSVVTSPGTPPKISLTGAANPAINNEEKANTQNEIVSLKGEANKELLKDFGQGNIAPQPNDEVLKGASVEATEINEFGANLETIPEVPAEVQGKLDAEGLKEYDKQSAEEVAKTEQAKTDLEQKAETEKQTTLDKIDQENEKTRQEQIKAKENANSDIQSHKENWKKENENVVNDLKNKSENEYNKVSGTIDKKISETQKESNDLYTKAEKDATSEKAKAEKEAAKKKEEANKKEKGFWDKLTDAVSDFFDKVKAGINAIFDGLRKLVKTIIEQAKKAVCALIDMARDFIVSAIKAFASVLKAFVNIALAAFPGLAAKFNALIDKAVDLAIKAVNLLADALKKVACALLDALGAVIDAYLAFYQKVINAALSVLEAITVGIIKIIRGIANIALSIPYGVMDLKGALFREFIGEDVTEPLPRVETTEKELPILEQLKTGNSGSPAGNETESNTDVERTTDLAGKHTLADGDLQVESSGPIQFEQELIAKLNSQIPDGGTMELGGSSNPVTAADLQENVMAANAEPATGNAEGNDNAQQIDSQALDADSMRFLTMTDSQKLDWQIEEMGKEPSQPDTKEKDGKEEAKDKGSAPDPGPIQEIVRKTGRLNIGSRLGFVGKQMLKGLQMFWSANKVAIIAGLLGILVVGGVVAFFTGGAGLIPLLQLGIQALTIFFLAQTMLIVKDKLWDWLSKAWNGDYKGGGASLASAFATIFSEFLLEYVLKGIGKIWKRIKAGLKATKVGRVIRKGMAMVKKVQRTFKRGVSKAIKGIRTQAGKFFMKLKSTFAKGIKKIEDLTNRLLEFFGFKRIWTEKHGKWIEVWGEFNPKFLIAKVDADGNSSYELHEIKNKRKYKKNADGSFTITTHDGQKLSGTKIKEKDVIITDTLDGSTNLSKRKRSVDIDGNPKDVTFINEHGVNEDLIPVFPGNRMPSNAKKFAGKELPLKGKLKRKYGDGVPFSKDGFPDFEAVLKREGIEIHKVRVKMSGNSAKDIAAAKKQFKIDTGKATPKGHTWHHSPDGKTMILVPTDLHEAARHFGGDSLTRARMGLSIED